MPAVSVIVLVYNSEKYLPNALRSLFGQTLEDIEYVIVDDGSKDGSMDLLQNILKEYPHRAAQVKVVSNQMNVGQAESRRKGVEASSGDYIIHCDSDDWIEPQMYEKLYSKALEGNCDMVLCRLQQEDAERNVLDSEEDDLCADDVLGALIGMRIHHYLLDKLVRRSAYDGIRFPKCNMWEDVAISIQLAGRCSTFGLVDEKLYHYVRRSDSLSSSKASEEKLEQMKNNVDLVASFLEEENLMDRYEKEFRHLRRMVKVYAQRLPLPYYKSLYPEENLDLLLDKRITLAEKMGHITTMVGIHGLSDKFKKK